MELCKILKFPVPTKQVQFYPARKWRLDFAYEDVKVGVELHGGTWVKGRHVTGSGFAKDREKINTAILQGWRVLECTREQMYDGDLFFWLRTLLGVVVDDNAILLYCAVYKDRRKQEEKKKRTGGFGKRIFKKKGK